jgi:hypothetical protein
MGDSFMSVFATPARSACLMILLAAGLAACGGGGGSDNPQEAQPPPEVPPQTPPPTTPDPLPPQAATAINLDDNHQVGATHWDDGATSTGAQGQPLNGLECLVNMPETYHVHTHLSIFLNGEALAVPGQIGIVPQTGGGHCFYAVHTHDKSGKLHVEAAAPGVFTLGMVFDEWGETLSTSEVAGLLNLPIVVYVTDDGVVTKATGDWRAIELKSHREITIQIGTAITEIPNFTWSAM